MSSLCRRHVNTDPGVAPGDDSELAGADAELAEVLKRFPDAPRLVGPDATREKVLDALGRQNVIACLWPVSDRVAVRMAHLLYNATRESALFLPADPATTLHQAMRHLRRRHHGFPSLWAPFIHLGAR